MDTIRFDRLTRLLGARENRRRLVLGLAGIVLGAANGSGAAPAAAATERERCFGACRDRCGSDPTNSKSGVNTDKACYARCQDRCTGPKR